MSEGVGAGAIDRQFRADAHRGHPFGPWLAHVSRVLNRRLRNPGLVAKLEGPASPSALWNIAQKPFESVQNRGPARLPKRDHDHSSENRNGCLREVFVQQEVHATAS